MLMQIILKVGQQNIKMVSIQMHRMASKICILEPHTSVIQRLQQKIIMKYHQYKKFKANMI